jgi:hypothetical protein
LPAKAWSDSDNKAPRHGTDSDKKAPTRPLGRVPASPVPCTPRPLHPSRPLYRSCLPPVTTRPRHVPRHVPPAAPHASPTCVSRPAKPLRRIRVLPRGGRREEGGGRREEVSQQQREWAGRVGRTTGRTAPSCAVARRRRTSSPCRPPSTVRARARPVCTRTLPAWGASHAAGRLRFRRAAGYAARCRCTHAELARRTPHAARRTRASPQPGRPRMPGRPAPQAGRAPARWQEGRRRRRRWRGARAERGAAGGAGRASRMRRGRKPSTPGPAGPQRRAAGKGV